MKNKFAKHWPFFITGPVFALFLISFWFFNQNYLSFDKGIVVGLLESPFLTFGLIIFGAFMSAFLGGDFDVKAPLTYEPLLFAWVGGILMGSGAALAAMSVHSVVLFNLAGIFTLTAFMVTQGWIYAGFMILGGFMGAKIFIFLSLKNTPAKRELLIPAGWNNKKKQRLVFFILFGLFVLGTLIMVVSPRMMATDKAHLLFTLGAMILFGMIVERGTVCMSSMLKEWFVARTAYVWRSVLFSIMCLALLYQLGLNFSFYPPVFVEKYIHNFPMLVLGSFLMGFGFIFADGCFIGSLWKAGQGNLVNFVGLGGMLFGMGSAQVVARIIESTQKVPASGGMVVNDLRLWISSFWFLIILWGVGLLCFLIFREKRYRF